MSTDSHCLIVMVACTMIIVIYMIKYNGLWSTWSKYNIVIYMIKYNGYCDLHDVIVIYMIKYNGYCDLHDQIQWLLWSTQSNTMVIVIYTIKYNGYCDLHDQIQWLLWSTRSNTMVIVIYTIQIQWFNCDVCDQRKKQRITDLLVLCELL